MNPLIQLWKEKGTYHEGLELLELYQSDHPLLPQLRKGVTAINELYLANAINGLSPDQLQPKRPKKAPPADEAAWLYRRLRQLYVLKNKTRNRYHEVRTVQARKKINRELIAYRAEIHEVARQIEYFESTGELPSIPELPPELSLSEDLAELMQQLLRVRPNLSKAKKALDNAYRERKRKKEIEKREQKYNHLLTQKEALEQRIKSIRQKATQ